MPVLKPVHPGAHALQREKPVHSDEDPAQPEIKKNLTLSPDPYPKDHLQKTPLIWELTSGSVGDLLALFLVRPFYLTGSQPRQNLHNEDVQSEKP